VIRPLNGLLAVASLIVALYLASGELLLPVDELAALFFVVSFGYAINDFFDFATDEVSRPGRPLPSGRLSRSLVVVVVAVTMGLGIIFATPTADAVFIYFLLLIVALAYYSKRLSGIAMVGNVTVALLCSSVFLLGGLIYGVRSSNWRVLVAAIVFSFLHHLAREVVKDMADFDGDAAAGRQTLPIRWSMEVALRVVTVVVAVLVAATYAFGLSFDFGMLYLVVVTVGVNLPLTAVMIYLHRALSRETLERASLYLKLIMLPGLAVLLLIAGI
jgi:4-hydroxybenzoate polyprenyltransferase